MPPLPQSHTSSAGWPCAPSLGIPYLFCYCNLLFAGGQVSSWSVGTSAMCFPGSLRELQAAKETIAIVNTPVTAASHCARRSQILSICWDPTFTVALPGLSVTMRLMRIRLMTLPCLSKTRRSVRTALPGLPCLMTMRIPCRWVGSLMILSVGLRAVSYTHLTLPTKA